MLSFSQYIKENYKNFIGADSIPQRKKWINQAWEMVQKSYEPIGGIKGSGFGSKKEMLEKIPFWKIYKKGDKLLVVVFYKDKGGRKTVAIATDGSDEAKKIVGKIYKDSLGVSYGEKSGPALGTLMKTVSWDELKNFMFTPEQVEKITGKKVIPIKKFGADNLDAKDKFTYDKFPKLRPYLYVRKLDGEYHLKAAMGTPNLPIFS